MANSPSGDSVADRIVRVLDSFGADRTVQTASRDGSGGLIAAPSVALRRHAPSDVALTALRHAALDIHAALTP